MKVAGRRKECEKVRREAKRRFGEKKRRREEEK